MESLVALVEDPAWVTNVLTLAALITALGASIYQSRQTNRHLGISILRDCERDFFYSQEMRRQRLIAARFILASKPYEAETMVRQPAPDEIFELMDFFGSVGVYVKDRVIPVDYAFNSFHYWFSKYFLCLHHHLEQFEQREGIKYYEHCRDLSARLANYLETVRAPLATPKKSLSIGLDEFISYEIGFLTPLVEAEQREMIGGIRRALPTHDSLAKILELESICFPSTWQYPDAQDYYRQMLETPGNINLFFWIENEIAGYLLAVPYNDAIGELKPHDALLEPARDDCYYVETIQVAPAHQRKGGAALLLRSVSAEAEAIGVRHLCMHARVNNGFSEIVKRAFRDATVKARPIGSWHFADGEPYEYVDISV
jgi:GNAT superfamily N-acetyltransferase